MKIFRSTLVLLSLAGLSAVIARADYQPYANIGQVAPTVLTYATSTGDLTGTFVGSNAGGEDKVRLYDVTSGTYSPYVLDNRTASMGDVASFGPVTAGDLLDFEIWNSDVEAAVPGFIMSSDPAYSTDGANHFYVTTVGSEVYLGAEDNSAAVSGTDYDYNDLTFGIQYSQVQAVAQTPEPSGLALLGTGLITSVGVLRSRRAAKNRS